MRSTGGVLRWRAQAPVQIDSEEETQWKGFDLTLALPMNLKKGALIFNNLRILRFIGSMREFIRGILFPRASVSPTICSNFRRGRMIGRPLEMLSTGFA
jgi:hypothetical protein